MPEESRYLMEADGGGGGMYSDSNDYLFGDNNTIGADGGIFGSPIYKAPAYVVSEPKYTGANIYDTGIFGNESYTRDMFPEVPGELSGGVPAITPAGGIRRETVETPQDVLDYLRGSSAKMVGDQEAFMELAQNNQLDQEMIDYLRRSQAGISSEEEFFPQLRTSAQSGIPLILPIPGIDPMTGLAITAAGLILSGGNVARLDPSDPIGSLVDAAKGTVATAGRGVDVLTGQESIWNPPQGGGAGTSTTGPTAPNAPEPGSNLPIVPPLVIGMGGDGQQQVSSIMGPTAPGMPEAGADLPIATGIGGAGPNYPVMGPTAPGMPEPGAGLPQSPGIFGTVPKTTTNPSLNEQQQRELLLRTMGVPVAVSTGSGGGTTPSTGPNQGTTPSGTGVTGGQPSTGGTGTTTTGTGTGSTQVGGGGTGTGGDVGGTKSTPSVTGGGSTSTGGGTTPTGGGGGAGTGGDVGGRTGTATVTGGGTSSTGGGAGGGSGGGGGGGGAGGDTGTQTSTPGATGGGSGGGGGGGGGSGGGGAGGGEGTTTSSPGVTGGGSSTGGGGGGGGGSTGGGAGGGAVMSTPIVINPISTGYTLPTTGTPAMRNLYQEATTSTQALGTPMQRAVIGVGADGKPIYGEVPIDPATGQAMTVSQGIASGYGGLARGMTQQDISNLLQSIQAQTGAPVTGGYQAALTQAANEQTAASNTALRSGNIADAEAFAMRAKALRDQANASLFGQGGALPQFTQQAQEQVGRDVAALRAAEAGQLSPEQIRNAQQAAREAYGARGQVFSQGAAAQEVLNRAAAVQQQQQLARQNLAQSMGQLGGAIGYQTANVFDPFATTLGGQYGMQTQNIGQNQALYNQAMGLTSGAGGYGFAQQMINPFSAYAGDVYGTNVNAVNAAQIAAANRQAALEAAKMGQTGTYAQALGNLIASGGLGQIQSGITGGIQGLLDLIGGKWPTR